MTSTAADVPVLPPLQADVAPAAAGRAPRDRFMVVIGLLVASAAIILDQATKQVAEVLLVRGRMVDWLGPHVGWQLIYNDAGAFGLPAPTWFFFIVTAVVTVIVLRNLPRVTSVPQAVAYGLLMAGAFGNIIDRVARPGGPGDPRFLHGHVVDFVAWGAWPRFNVADIAITSGFALLLLSLFLEERRAAEGA